MNKKQLLAEVKQLLGEANRPTGNELKAEIVKQLGLSPRDISVRYDGSYHIQVKSWIPREPIEDVAKKYEAYTTDDASGEILSGGNTFVFVDYQYGLPLTDDMRQKIENLPVINFGGIDLSDGEKLFAYAKKLAAELGGDWTATDARKVLSADYILAKEIINRPYVNEGRRR